MQDRSEEVEENTKNSREFLTEFNDILRDAEHQRTGGESSVPTPPPPSVKLSDHNNLGYELEISGEQFYTGNKVNEEQEFTEEKSLHHNSEIANPLSYAEECMAVLPDINPLPRELNVDQYLKEKERNNTQVPNQRVKLANAYRQRIFQRTFSRQNTDQEVTEETVQSLSIEGKGKLLAREAMRNRRDSSSCCPEFIARKHASKTG